jgi:hypothetical protein
MFPMYGMNCDIIQKRRTDMPFEKFTLGGKTFSPRVAIRRSGQIGFNNGARLRFNLDSYTYVVLYYDAEDKKIGIELTTNENETGAIRLQKRQLNVSISAKSFFEYYKISYEKKQIFSPKWDESRKMIILELQPPIPEGSR